MRWLVLLALSGCAVIASSHDVEIPRSVHVMPTFVGPPTGVVLNVTASYATLHVDATRTRTCFREVRQFVEHRRETEPGPLAGPLVAGATAVANALDSDSWIEDRSLRVTTSDCSLAARAVVLEVALPSGTVMRARTDDRGLAHVKIPRGEPERGVAIVRAGDDVVRIAYAADEGSP